MAGSEFVRELFAQREWLARLAFSLVNDESLADDLVQDTWLSALRTQPARDAGLRAWLATVMRNRARTHARDDRERRRREQWAAREELLPSAGDVLERAAIQQEVGGVVMQLAEPYREIILLRFFDELRLSLDRNYGGDRSRWMASVAVLCEAQRSGWLAKACAAAGVLLISGGTAWVALQPDSHQDADERVAIAEDETTHHRVEIAFEQPKLPRQPSSESDAAGTPGEPAKTSASTLAKDVELAAPSSADTAGRLTATPPGLVYLPGGTVQIGVDIGEAPPLESKAGETYEPKADDLLLAASYPRHERTLEAFSLMGTEVTNEQYLEYVVCTAALPPIGWAMDLPKNFGSSLLESLMELGYLQEKDLKSARTKLDYPPEVYDWWWSHTSGRILGLHRNWEIPEGQEQMPVVNVSYEQAQGFATWAGLRLPSEFEMEHATRGKQGWRFPWGDQWRQGFAITDITRPGLQLIGSNRRGRTKSGIDNLAGNVREWTSSAFVAYPGLAELRDSMERMEIPFALLQDPWNEQLRARP